MRILLSLIIDTIPILSDVLLLGLLIFTIFGIIGVQLWKGMFNNRCFINEFESNITNGDFYKPENGGDFLCSLSGGMTTCQDIPILKNNVSYAFCRSSNYNPYDGSISFDNIGFAFIAIFQVYYLII